MKNLITLDSLHLTLKIWATYFLWIYFWKIVIFFVFSLFFNSFAFSNFDSLIKIFVQLFHVLKFWPSYKNNSNIVFRTDRNLKEHSSILNHVQAIQRHYSNQFLSIRFTNIHKLYRLTSFLLVVLNYCLYKKQIKGL